MRALMLGMLVFVSLTAAACDRDGPAERAGEEVDEAVDDMKDAVDDE